MKSLRKTVNFFRQNFKFGIEVERVFATPGPVVTLYELVPAADVKLSKLNLFRMILHLQ